MDNDYIYVMYNSCYGGFYLSEEAINEYNKTHDVKICEYSDNRTDKDLIQICRNLGVNCNTDISYIKYAKIHKKYECYIRIYDYDGKESIKIDYNKYKFEEIKTLINDLNISNNDLRMKIKDIIDLEDIKVIYE